MKSFRGEWMKLSLALLATSAGCALVGYDLSGYKAADTGGAGGSASAGTPSSSTAGHSTGTSESAGPGGKGGNSTEAGTSSASSGEESTGSGKGSCTLPTDCDDHDPCTLNQCDPDKHCVFPEAPNCCAHSICDIGAPLDADACVFKDPTVSTNCVAELCGTNEACCSSAWSKDCVEDARKACVPLNAPPNTVYSCKCAHSYCVEGLPLDQFCDPCVHAVCSQTGFDSCCALVGGLWGPDCTAAIHMYCNVPVDLACP